MNERSSMHGARLATLPVLVAALFASGGAAAFQIESDNPDVRMSWDNTVKYSASWRVESASSQVAGNPATAQVNTNDGDLNFDRGLISNRLDLLSEFSFNYKRQYGFRVSGAAWYDSVYQGRNDNPGNQGVNSLSVASNAFTKETEQLHGRKAEFMDAFIYGNFAPGGKSLNLKFGRFTQLYGESLFFGSNGIAGAQTPLDLAKALSVPNSQFKEVARPVGQVSAQLQLSPTMTIGGYYQGEWRKTRLPAVGSYFSFSDFADEGGEALLLGPGVYLHRGKDMKAKDSGQGGMQLRFKSGDSEFGLYGAIFHDKMPQFYARPGVNAANANDIGDYMLVYAENIRTVGASMSTLVGESNVAAELSLRDNMPLTATGATVVMPGNTTADNGARAAFPKGRTLHFNASAISVLAANSLWDGASFIGEFAYNRLLSISDNPDQLDPLATKDASALQFVFQPEYFQVVPGLDLQVPIGVSYGLSGRSAVNGVLFPSEKGGNLSIGVKGSYQRTWRGSVNWTHYFGSAGAIIQPAAAPTLSYTNFHGDRDFVSISIERTF
ncbi:DUF1302 domain-containing protein [Azoarcus sp. L1K30]|uniref:DUF1302 domain-containing protein n=1 Tax=Azoarcus sp. L1K30 TaxID=2820277 RepID=UPI001B8295DB|nr:DUF1302 domain-containing protein [Azoarcus sp. L1K30]MBR0565626.1 DUF1302 domain-containing protein [Azoarcus sp. L1K30]